MTCDGESDKEKYAWLTHIWLRHGVTQMVTILNRKPMTQHYGYGFLVGSNMATCTQTRDLNPCKTYRFTHTCQSLLIMILLMVSDLTLHHIQAYMSHFCGSKLEIRVVLPQLS